MVIYINNGIIVKYDTIISYLTVEYYLSSLCLQCFIMEILYNHLGPIIRVLYRFILNATVSARNH